MSDDERLFFSIFGQLPVRLSVEQVARILNCGDHSIRALVKAKHLKPLGDPPENGEKMFSRDELLELTKKRNFLDRITNTIHKGHHDKRLRLKARQGNLESNGSANGHDRGGLRIRSKDERCGCRERLPRTIRPPPF